MSVHDALALMLEFGGFLLVLLTYVDNHNNKK